MPTHAHGRVLLKMSVPLVVSGQASPDLLKLDQGLLKAAPGSPTTLLEDSSVPTRNGVRFSICLQD